MWGTSLPEEKLAGDLGNVIEAPPNRQSSVGFFTAGKFGPSRLGLFQQHRSCMDGARGARGRSDGSAERSGAVMYPALITWPRRSGFLMTTFSVASMP